MVQENLDELGGADTTDESESEETQYERRRNEVIETSTSVFVDADDEYGSLPAVKRRLEAWKRSHPEAYANAYAADSVPAIFAPFVRNELLSWDPVFQQTKGEWSILAMCGNLSTLSTTLLLEEGGNLEYTDENFIRFVQTLTSSSGTMFCWTTATPPAVRGVTMSSFQSS